MSFIKNLFPHEMTLVYHSFLKRISFWKTNVIQINNPGLRQLDGKDYDTLDLTHVHSSIFR
jgi:hypothetical protein